MIRYIIALREMGIKNNRILNLLSNNSSDIIEMFTDDSIFESRFELLEYRDVFADKVLINDALEKADIIIAKDRDLKIKETYYTSDSYPKELAKIDNPPAIIYYKGAEFSEVSDNAIACVGTRKPTRLSYNAVNYLIPQWVNEGCSIISGLACGVDKLSHQSCISSGGRTIAVLAHGLDTVYPKGNEELAERIIHSGGILMSEYSVGTKADKYRFVDRNRLIVGMSRVIIIYECDIKGGTMHNVDFAHQQNKVIFSPAIDDEPIDIQTGTKKLLNENIARVIKQGRDIQGVFDVLGIKRIKATIPTLQLKKLYLKSLLEIVNSEKVIDAVIQELKMEINSSIFFEAVINLVDTKKINLDMVINSLISNNIASVNQTIFFND